MYYIGLASADLAIERISHRIAVGGHAIEGKAVERRFRSSLRNLSHAISLCDEVTVLDNTSEFVVLARWSDGVLTWAGKVAKHGQWLLDAMRDDVIWKA